MIFSYEYSYESRFNIYMQIYSIWTSIRTFIWLIFTRSNTPLEIYSWFPQLMFTLLTRVRSIKVKILNSFLRLADHRLPILLFKKKMKRRNLRMHLFIYHLNCFFLVFENKNILSSKSYTVTKSGISQRKLGSLRNF